MSSSVSASRRGAGLDHPPECSVSVLQVTAGLDPASGGPPVCAVATALALGRKGCVNEVAFPVERGREDASSELLALLHANGSRVHRFREPLVFGDRGRRWGISLELAAWLLRRARQFDVIHTHSAWTFPTIVALFCAKVFGRVAVISPHESLTDFDQRKSGRLHRKVKQLLRQVYLRTFDVVIVASALEQDDMRTGRSRLVVVPHAVMGVRRSVGVRPVGGNLRVGYLGRLDPKKNIDILIDAVASLPETVTLSIAGEGPPEYRRALTARVASSGIEHRVKWLGFVDRRAKPEFFASIDVLAMPSEFECFGVSAAEALSAGVPVLVSPNVGVARVVAEYGCGQVVPAAAPEFALALNKFLEDGQARHTQSEAAEEAASREFSIEGHGDRLVAAYESALRARPRARRRTTIKSA
jgi:glycosyltransferase involved in cell wall biosynthesis